jgi:hypothetical protein
MILKNTEVDRPWISHADGNCVIVEGLIREDRRVKYRETQCKKSSYAIPHIPWKGTLQLKTKLNSVA